MNTIPSKSSAEPQLNPWFSIWTKPRPTIRQVMQTVSMGKLMWILALTTFVGVIRAMLTSSQTEAESLFNGIGSFWGSLLMGVLLTPLGILMFWLLAWLIKVAGRWLGSKASTREVMYGLTWPNVMTLVVNIGVLITVLSFQKVCHFLGMTWYGEFSELMWALNLVFFTVIGILTLWNIAVFIICMSEVMQISKLRVCGVCLLSWVLVVVGLALLMIPIGIAGYLARGGA